MQREAPPTEEGWYALHDLRHVDWDAWRAAPEHERERALEEGIEYLRAHEAVEDADEGQSAVYSVVGHGADLLVVHLRPTVGDLDAAERRFEGTAFARFTERADSFVSVTEASGYTERAREFFEGDLDEDSGLAQYIYDRLHPEIPDAEFVSFYPMEKRRQPDQNWYDLPFEERAEHMERHGSIGRQYGGKVSQMITGAVGIDDWEWGVTLWADDLTDVKELLYEMRFDPSSSRFADFGPFYVGRRFPPADLGALLAGESIPTGDAPGADDPANADERSAGVADADEASHATGDGGRGAVGDEGGTTTHSASGTTADSESGAAAEETDPTGGRGHPDSGSGGRPGTDDDGSFAAVEDLPRRLAQLGFRAGEDYDDGDYGLVFYSSADAQELAEAVEGLRGNFEHYDRHVTTVVRAQGGRSAAVSVWTAKDAAETAAQFLGDLPGVEERYGGPLPVDRGAAGDEGASDAAAEADSDAAAEEDSDAAAADAVREQLADLDVYAGQPHGEDVYALVLYSRADADDLAAAVGDLREAFADQAGHVRTSVYEPHDEDGARAVASLWESEAAADAVADRLADLPGVVGRPEDRDGFGTMGMFYTVRPDYREAFLDTFEDVEDLLEGMDGHRETGVLVNADDENDMFIASRWDGREDAMAFFRSEEFAETVEWGREVLADRPRHVFLA